MMGLTGGLTKVDYRTSFSLADRVRICSSYESSRWSAFSSDTSSDLRLLPTTRSSSSSSTILLQPSRC